MEKFPFDRFKLIKPYAISINFSTANLELAVYLFQFYAKGNYPQGIENLSNFFWGFGADILRTNSYQLCWKIFLIH